MRGTGLLVSTLILLTTACGAEGGGTHEELQAGAAAALGQKEEDPAVKAAMEKAEAERKKAHEERKKKEAEEAAKLEAMSTELVGLPEKLPKNLEAACTELIEKYRLWIQAIYFDDDGAQLAFFDSKGKNLGEVKGKCAKVGKLEFAACMIHVIEGVSVEGYPQDKLKLLQGKPEHLFNACLTKYAPDYVPEAVTPVE